MKEMLTSRIGSFASYLKSYIVKSSDEDELSKQIQQCCYPKENTEFIHASLSKILGEQPDLKAKTKAIAQYPPKSIITLSGSILVPFGANKYSVVITIIIPQLFPNQPPTLSIYNIDSERFSVHTDYERGRVDNNQYILPLSAVNQWKEHKQLKAVIDQSKELMSKKFPFRKKNMSSLIMERMNPALRGMPAFRASLLFLDDATSMVSKLDSSKQFSQIQRLECANLAVQHQILTLRQHNIKLAHQISKHEREQHLDIRTVINMDTNSSQLLDLIAEEYAYTSDIQFLENKLFNKDIELETFLRLIRKIEEERFTLRVCIRYLIQSSSFN